MIDPTAGFPSDPSQPAPQVPDLELIRRICEGGFGQVWLGYWSSRPPRVHVNFTTYPFEATVLIDGQQQTTFDGQPGTTPCTIEDLPARRHHVIFRLSGRPDLDAGEVDFGRSREIKARWGASTK